MANIETVTVGNTTYEIEKDTVITPTYFSTVEQEVGKWIDGSTIYETTYTGLNKSIADNSWVNVVPIPSGLTKLIDARYLTTDIVLNSTETRVLSGYINMQHQSGGGTRVIDTAIIDYLK